MTQSQLLAQLQQIKTVTGAQIAYYQPDGKLKISTDEQPEISPEKFTSFLAEGDSCRYTCGLWFFRLENRDQTLGILTMTSCAENMDVIGKLAAGQFSLALSGGREGLDRVSFFAGLLRGELAGRDVTATATRLHLDPALPRLVYAIETESPYDQNALQTIRSIYPESGQNYLISLTETQMALLTAAPSRDSEKLLDVAETLVDMLSMEALCNARVAHSTVAEDLRKLPQAMQEALAALEIGKIFYTDRKVNAYSSLGIGRLIYQLPRPLCQMYLQEVFGDDLPEIFDEETLNLVEKFFENNLNTSETARKLYIHRNTLIYRLDKIQKETGLDLRTFDDALMVKVALLVRAYLLYQDKTR